MYVKKGEAVRCLAYSARKDADENPWAVSGGESMEDVVELHIESV